MGAYATPMNLLAQETSPYLLQHADNPVDWHPWGEEALGRARAEGRSAIAILTRPSMQVAHNLYETLGFKRDMAADWEFEPGEWLWGYRLGL